MSRLLIILVYFLSVRQVFCQQRSLEVYKTTSTVVIDGIANEKDWNLAGTAGGFINKWPKDTGLAVLQTTAKILYDDQNLYVFISAGTTGKKLVVQSRKRDQGGNPWYSDGVSIVIDPYGKGISGYVFGVNSEGAQYDGIATNNNADFTQWDAKWFSATKKYADHWTAEMAIPLKAIRFPAGGRTWSVNFIRNDMFNNCFSTWQEVPLAFFGANLSYMGRAGFPDSLREPGFAPAFLPYLSLSRNAKPGGSATSVKLGADIKIPLTSSLKLDLAINPDFSEAEVDQQVINLTTHSILLPEKRPFFYEANDLSATLGTDYIRPFVSRTIGLTSGGQPLPLLGGVRLSGNLSPSLRITVMDMQSANLDSLHAQNYLLAVAEKGIINRSSNIKAFLTSAQDMGTGNAGKNFVPSYNRVAGAEFNYVSNDGSKAFGLKTSESFHADGSRDGSFFGLNLSSRTKSFSISGEIDRVGENFTAALGYVPRLYNYDVTRDSAIRLGYFQVSGVAEYDVYPSHGKINERTLQFIPALYWFNNGRFNEGNFSLNYSWLTADRKTFRLGYTQIIVSLPFETSIFSSLDHLAARQYSYGVADLGYESNFLRPFSWKADLQAGGFYNGSRTSITGGVKQRLQPWLTLATDVNYNFITVNGKSIYPFLVNPSAELAFSTKLFFTTFLQYNSLLKNFNLNARFNCRFRPLSDIFIVFNSNYMTPSYTSTGSLLAVKISYRIN